jgi:transposase-like protein
MFRSQAKCQWDGKRLRSQRCTADDTAFHAKCPTQWESSAIDMYFRGMSVSDIREHLKQEHGYSPSKSVTYGWIDRYTDKARKQFKDCHPQMGDVWIAVSATKVRLSLI